MATITILTTLFIFTTPCIFSCTPTTSHGHRRSLHQPFFPLLSAPSPPHTSPPPPPLPFFPIYPSPPPPPPSPPPPPPPSTVPTFPANFSSSSAPRRSSYRHLAPLLAIPVAVLALLVLALAFLLLNRRPDAAADSHCLFPPDTAASDGTKLPPSSNPPAPDFLYLGTLVSSRSAADPPAASGSPYHKLDSPELRPLPPLSRHVNPSSADDYSDDEFGHAASSSEEKRRKRSSPASTLSSPSYSSSLSSSSPPPLIDSSPGRSTVRSRSSEDSVFQPPPAAVAPPRLHPPAVPLLPKKKSSSISSHTPEIVTIGCFATNPFTTSPPPQRRPPPPLPLAGYSETTVPVMPAFQTRIESEAKVNSDSPENGKAEAQPQPKLKPLHWGELRASSDREMVWDHLKRSSLELNEEMIATLFGHKAVNAADKENARMQLGSSLSEEKRVLEPKELQNIAILMGGLNVIKEEVCEALLEGSLKFVDSNAS